MSLDRWIIIGAGRVGRALGLVARNLGRDIAATWNRGEAARRDTAALLPEAGAHLHGPTDALAAPLARPALVWLTVVDDVLEDVARAIAPLVCHDSVVLHTAGSLSSTLLTEAGVGAACGSLHPLQAISDPHLAREAMARCVWTIEGHPRAVAAGRAVMRGIGVEPLDVHPEAKALYHASAVCAANLLVGLIDAAYEMAARAGIPRAQARAMLLPLAQSSLDNLQKLPPEDALTGPAARGDVATIARHVEALSGDEQLSNIYSALTARALEVARRRDAQAEEE